MTMVKRILLGLLGIVVVVIAGIALAFFNWNGASGFIARQASKALNREVAVDGGMKVTLGDPIQIHVEGIRVANVEWSDEKNIMELKALDAWLRLWPLLRGAWELPELRLTAPKLVLEKNKDGVPNVNQRRRHLLERRHARRSVVRGRRRIWPWLGTFAWSDQAATAP